MAKKKKGLKIYLRKGTGKLRGRHCPVVFDGSKPKSAKVKGHSKLRQDKRYRFYGCFVSKAKAMTRLNQLKAGKRKFKKSGGRRKRSKRC